MVCRLWGRRNISTLSPWETAPVRTGLIFAATEMAVRPHWFRPAPVVPQELTMNRPTSPGLSAILWPLDPFLFCHLNRVRPPSTASRPAPKFSLPPPAAVHPVARDQPGGEFSRICVSNSSGLDYYSKDFSTPPCDQPGRSLWSGCHLESAELGTMPSPAPMNTKPHPPVSRPLEVGQCVVVGLVS